MVDLMKLELDAALTNKDASLTLEPQDYIYVPRLLNYKFIVKTIEKNDKGDITINGKPLLRFRIVK